MRLVMLVLLTVGLVSLSLVSEAQTPAPSPAVAPTDVAAILRDHDRTLVKALQAYLGANPNAEDREQAYMVLFERVIENDWYTDAEATAREYLKSQPGGAVVPLARIVATMARAQGGQFEAALSDYRSLVQGLNQPEQEEFASNFADSLAGSAVAAGEVEVARKVYELLLQQYGDSPNLRQKVEDELARLALVGRPAPPVTARTMDGKPLRLSDLRGKYVLVDFWATWCAPCVSDLPSLRSAYDRYHDRGFEIVAVSLDESPQAVSDFVRTRKLPWTQLHQASCDADLVAAFKVGSIPASYLIGPDGTVLRMNLKGEGLQKLLATAIK